MHFRSRWFQMIVETFKVRSSSTCSSLPRNIQYPLGLFCNATFAHSIGRMASACRAACLARSGWWNAYGKTRRFSVRIIQPKLTVVTRTRPATIILVLHVQESGERTPFQEAPSLSLKVLYMSYTASKRCVVPCRTKTTWNRQLLWRRARRARWRSWCMNGRTLTRLESTMNWQARYDLYIVQVGCRLFKLQGVRYNMFATRMLFHNICATHHNMEGLSFLKTKRTRALSSRKPTILTAQNLQNQR